MWLAPITLAAARIVDATHEQDANSRKRRAIRDGPQVCRSGLSQQAGSATRDSSCNCSSKQPNPLSPQADACGARSPSAFKHPVSKLAPGSLHCGPWPEQRSAISAI